MHLKRCLTVVAGLFLGVVGGLLLWCSARIASLVMQNGHPVRLRGVGDAEQYGLRFPIGSRLIRGESTLNFPSYEGQAVVALPPGTVDEFFRASGITPSAYYSPEPLAQSGREMLQPLRLIKTARDGGNGHVGVLVDESDPNEPLAYVGWWNH